MHELINMRTGEEIIFPSDIDELSGDQYLFYLDLALKYITGELQDAAEIKRMLFVKLTDLKVSNKMQFYDEQTQEAIWSALTDKINLLDSFFDIETGEDGGVVYKMHLQSGINLLPEWNGLKGTDDMLDNLKWGEFVQCLTYLKLINAAREEEREEEIEGLSLELFKILYKPKNGEKYPKEVPDTVLFHAINYFGYVYELITTTPIPINGEEVDFSIIWKSDDDTANKDTENKSGWSGVLFGIAETGIFGTAADVNKAGLYEILLFLYNRKMQEKADKKRLNNIGNGKPE